MQINLLCLYIFILSSPRIPASDSIHKIADIFLDKIHRIIYKTHTFALPTLETNFNFSHIVPIVEYQNITFTEGYYSIRSITFTNFTITYYFDWEVKPYNSPKFSFHLPNHSMIIKLNTFNIQELKDGYFTYTAPLYISALEIPLPELENSELFKDVFNDMSDTLKKNAGINWFQNHLWAIWSSFPLNYSQYYFDLWLQVTETSDGLMIPCCKTEGVFKGFIREFYYDYIFHNGDSVKYIMLCMKVTIVKYESPSETEGICFKSVGLFNDWTYLYFDELAEGRDLFMRVATDVLDKILKIIVD